MTTALTQEQLTRFSIDGFVRVEQILGEEVLAPLQAELEATIEQLARQAVADGELRTAYSDLPFDRRLAAITSETDAVLRPIHGRGQLHGPAIFELLRYQPLLDAIESLVGPEIIASSVYRVRAKLPGGVGRIAWHQDSAFFEPACDGSLIVTVWVPLVDATVENGCLWLWPGVHRNGLRRHVPALNAGALGLGPEALPEEGVVPVPARRGDVILFGNMTPHASFENKTERIRWSVDLRYQSASLPTNAPITRLPGESSAEVDDGVPLACYPPEADMLVRSTARPDEVVGSAEEFRRLREEHVVASVSRRWISDDGADAYPPL